jgi:pyruvate dehydrogenase E1 component beta subunit
VNASTTTFGQALLTSIVDEMEKDERVLFLATNPPPLIMDTFGEDRVRRTPIAESAMTGMAVGAAGSGYRPIVWWGNVTFSFVAFDQIVNQAARIRYMFGGQRDFPIVFYASYLNGQRSAAQHSQTGLAFYAHAAGLKLVAPSTPQDASSLMRSAIRDDNPVVYAYSDRLSGTEGVVDTNTDVSIGTARVARVGTDVTVVAIGGMAPVAMSAAESLQNAGISVEVVDPRSIVPMDVECIRRSVQKTGRLVVIDESFPTCSVASEVATLVAEDDATFRALRAPLRRVCTAPVPVPFSPVLEDFVLPDTSDLYATVTQLVAASA